MMGHWDCNRCSPDSPHHKLCTSKKQPCPPIAWAADGDVPLREKLIDRSDNYANGDYKDLLSQYAETAEDAREHQAEIIRALPTRRYQESQAKGIAAMLHFGMSRRTVSRLLRIDHRTIDKLLQGVKKKGPEMGPV